MIVLNILSLLAVAVVGVPIGVLFVECTAALLARRPAPPLGSRRSLALLVPAHNEEILIGATVRSLMTALLPGDRLIVVADNCTDRTAQIAAAEGATVLERHDLSNRGKGFALSHGIESLRSNPPAAVIVFDADIAVETVAVDLLARAVEKYSRPVQARYVLSAPASAGVRGVVSSLAFVTKNVVRPAGMRALGMPCPLLGTGMAFQWEIISTADIRGGHLVEDMQLGVDLLRHGHATVFCESASIDGDLPDRGKAALDQRTRWEHGHLSVIRTACIPLFKTGMTSGRLDCIAAGLDLCIPPLALLSLAWAATVPLAVIAGLTSHHWYAATAAFVEGAMLAAAVFMAWLRAGRHIPLRSLAGVPLYVFWKMPLYVRWMVKPQKKWVRTERVVGVASGENA